MNIFRGELYCRGLANVVVDMNVEILKEIGILLPQFAQNVVEICF